jgi:hypothetical protein
LRRLKIGAAHASTGRARPACRSRFADRDYLPQVLSVTLIEKTPMLQALSETTITSNQREVETQLNLFDF